MSLFARHETRATVGAIPTNGELSRRASPRLVTPETALQLSTVWSCRNLIAGTIATLPWGTYRDTDTIRVKEKTQPRIVTNPSTMVQPIGWRRQVIDSWLSRGNAWGLVTGTDQTGRPTGIDIVHPDHITVARRGRTGPYEFRYLNNPIDLYPNGPLWHCAAFEQPGSMLGLSVIENAAQSIGLGLATEDYGFQWFLDGAHPSGILSSDQALADEGQAAAVKARFVKATQNREPAVLGAGLKYDQIQTAANESQFLETIGANKITIADFFGLPVEMVNGSTSSMTYANVEQRLLHLFVLGLLPWIVRLEAVYDSLTARPFVVRADPDGLLRLDAKTAAEIEDTRIGNGTWSPDDARAKRNEPPLPNGSGAVYLWPPAGASAQKTGGPGA